MMMMKNLLDHSGEWRIYCVSNLIGIARMTMLKIRVLMEDETLQAENVECPLGTELRDAIDGDTESSFPKYFPCFDQSFEEVVYPNGEIDVVSIGKRDVDMLLPDTFVNDTIIDFYIKYVSLLHSQL
ncbi:hypothetical protein Tco_1196937 [Tanacetum coccineum]